MMDDSNQAAAVRNNQDSQLHDDDDVLLPSSGYLLEVFLQLLHKHILFPFVRIKCEINDHLKLGIVVLLQIAGGLTASSPVLHRCWGFLRAA